MFTLSSIRQQPIKPKKDLFDSITLTGSCSAISASKELWVKWSSKPWVTFFPKQTGQKIEKNMFHWKTEDHVKTYCKNLS